MRNITNTARLASAVALLAFAAPSYALCDACVVGAVTGAATTITTAIGSASGAISGSVNAMNTAVNNNLVYWFGQVVQAQKGSASQISQIVKETGTLQGQTAIAVAQNGRYRDAQNRWSTTNPCLVSASSQGMADTLRSGSLTLGGSGRGGGGGRRTRGGGTDALNKALDIAERRVPAPAPEVAAAVAAAGACGSFAAGGLRADACRAAQLPAGNANGHPDADITAATLMDGPQTSPATPTKRYTIDMTKDSPEEKAVSAFLRNLNTPLELRALTQGELGTDAGRRYLAVKDVYEARMSMANAPAQRQAYQIGAKTDTIPMVKDLMSSGGDPAFVSRYLSRNAPNWAAKGISADELMNLEVERRYMNLEWMKRTVDMTPEYIQREQLRVAALQNVLLWRSLQEARQSGVLLGTLVASQVRQELLPELKAAHSAATR